MNTNSAEEKTPDSSQRSADGSQDFNTEVQRRLDDQDERLVVFNQAIVNLKTKVEQFEESIQSSIGELTKNQLYSYKV